MSTAQTLGFLAGYILFTTSLLTILILTNRITFTITSIAIIAFITASITASGALLKKALR